MMQYRQSKPYKKSAASPIPTPADVERPLCPKCQTDIYVKPFVTGYMDYDEELEREIEEGRVSVEYNCVITEFWEWDCTNCRIKFAVEEDDQQMDVAR